MTESPTIYDYLLLSLRKKDVVATFNWDLLLVQAAWKNRNLDIPNLVFLHGNVGMGYCKDRFQTSLKGFPCQYGEKFEDKQDFRINPLYNSKFKRSFKNLMSLRF